MKSRPTCQCDFHHVFKVNILHIRALVKADTVVLFDTYGSVDSRLHSVFLYHLEVSFRWSVSQPHVDFISAAQPQG